eukprot:TRINITY_DN15771_c0_g1_i1.p1 TRINITY_DN15771_c0_g1~~TRINITY_DN15771_c0_g1_i1.p1  ORF type:complete len:433 (+),score=43.79 TRINITY_DN15771_c0_g1_i1:119-1417(+)
MSEALFIHIGQAGVQIGSAIWELFCFEHGIQPDGQLPEDGKASNDQAFSCTFESSGKEKFTPRAIMFDTDPITINQVRRGAYRSLFKADNIICPQNMGGGDGHWILGHHLPDDFSSAIRRLLESSDRPGSITITHSMAGSAGTFAANKVISNLSKWLTPTCSVNTCSILPASLPARDTIVTSPYNAAFGLLGMEKAHLCMMMDNPGLGAACQRLGVKEPNFTNLNRLIAQGLSSISASSRFDSPLRCNLSELPCELCPNPGMKLVSMSHAPGQNAASVGDMTSELLKSESQLLSGLNVDEGKFLGINAFYRGDIMPKDVQDTMCGKRGELSERFCAMARPSTINCSITYRQGSVLPGSGLSASPRSATMLANTTAMKSRLEAMGRAFDGPYRKRAFVNHYCGSGMEEGEFSEARENLSNLIESYESSYNASS